MHSWLARGGGNGRQCAPDLVASDNEKFTVLPAPARLPRRKPNAEYRSREHLTEREVERLIEAIKGHRWGTP